VTKDPAAEWVGEKGRFWAENADWFSRMLGDFQSVVIDGAALTPGERVLDVGCGGGDVAMAAADAVGPTGTVLGIDLSPDELDVARVRAAQRGLDNVDFREADASSDDLGPWLFDVLTSRFGVMFFADPVAAFAHLRRAAVDGAALNVVVWRSAAENPFMTTAEGAAAPLLPNLLARKPDGLGQFAFADAGRVMRLLEAGGWGAVELRPLDVPCVFPTVDLDGYVERLGPVGVALQAADEATRQAVTSAVRAAFEPYVHGDEVRFTAACWVVQAQAA
jgi:SAM-dependent methyltransferase